MARTFNEQRTHTSLISALARARSKFGSKRVAIEDADGRKLSYDEVFRGAFAIGNALRAKTVRGEVVGVLLPTGAGALVAFFALHAFGRIPGMLNFTAGSRNLKAALSMAQMKSIVTARRFVELGELHNLIAELEKDVEIIFLEDVRDALTPKDKMVALAGATFPSLVAQPGTWRDPGVFLFTSGTEGDPKGVVLSHANIIANVEQIMAHVPELTSDDVVFNPLPTFHCFGLTAGALLPLLAGIKAVFHPSPLHVKDIPKRIRETSSTILFATDTFVSQYARASAPEDMTSLRFAVCGAERVRDETRALLRRKFDVPLIEGYGATEASPVIAVNTPSDNRPGTVGTLLPGMEHRLEPVEGIANAGRLFVRGPNVMNGYVHVSAPGVVEPPVDGWHDTGDVVSIDEDGFISIKGRVKRFAKIGGEMVSLAVVENCASTLWPENAHAAASVPDPRKGEQIILVTDCPHANRADLLAFAQNHGVPELAVPRRVVLVTEVPLLGTGKVDYGAVGRLVADASKPATASDDTAPAST